MVGPITSEAALPCCKYPYPFLVLCFEAQLSQSHAIRTVTSFRSCFRRVSFFSPGIERSYSMGLQYMAASFFFMRSIFFMEMIEISGLLPIRSSLTSGSSANLPSLTHHTTLFSMFLHCKDQFHFTVYLHPQTLSRIYPTTSTNNYSFDI